MGENKVVRIDQPAPAPEAGDSGLPIRHHVPVDHQTSTKRPCVWCGAPTDILAETPFAPQLGYLPLMLTCGAHMRIVYRRVQEGLPLDEWETERVAAIRGLLGDGQP